MQVVQAVFSTIYGILNAIVMFMLCYQLFLSIFGFGKKTKDYKDHEPESRFLVLVPAHNEEKVIAGIIENLQHMEYPKELYDFYIIADNCEDRTADVARQMGAKVIETRKESPDAPTGKPIALRKALEALGDYQNRYDLLMVFDADNLMDPNMFLEVNSQYLDKGKPELIQCYLGAKNKKGVVAWFYYTSYTITNRFFQLAKHRLGLNTSIGGTGFAMSTQYLYQRGGWTTMSLTEDFEIQIEATVEGKRILWNHNARVYDEKPTSVRASLHQRTRWAQGHWFVCFRNTKKVFSALFHGRISIWEAISVIAYMYSLLTYIVITLQMVVNLAGLGIQIAQGADWGLLASGVWLGLLIFIYGFLLEFYVADRMDNHTALNLKTIPITLLSFVVNMVVATLSQWAGLFKFRHQNQWNKTEHSIQHLEGCGECLPGHEAALTEPETAMKD